MVKRQILKRIPVPFNKLLGLTPDGLNDILEEHVGSFLSDISWKPVVVLSNQDILIEFTATQLQEAPI